MLTTSVAVQPHRPIRTISMGPEAVFPRRSESITTACPLLALATKRSPSIQFTLASTIKAPESDIRITGRLAPGDHGCIMSSEQEQVLAESNSKICGRNSQIRAMESRSQRRHNASMVKIGRAHV